MRDRILAFLVLLPSVLAVGVFVYGFIGQNLWVSLTDWGKDPAQALALRPELRFVGLENYRELFTGFVDVRFRQSVVNLIFFTLFFIILSLSSILQKLIHIPSLFNTSIFLHFTHSLSAKL